METGRELWYLGDRLSKGGGYEAAVTTKIRYGWPMSRESGELLCGKRFPLRLKRAVNKN